MMNAPTLKYLCCTLLLLAASVPWIHGSAVAQSSANYAIAFHLIDNGGAPSTAAASAHTAHSLIGQAAVHTYAQSNTMLLSSGAGCAFCGSQITVGIDPAILPMMMRLYQNYPNPFNPGTTIRYSLEREASIELAVYNLFGEKVDVIVRERQSPGDYSIDYHAGELTSGVYLYRLVSEHGQLSRRFVLLK
ncbi:MAG: T9SS type A sorting domain-containing protein [Bacteroidetes bacterium]|nr:T9SS type A sorting domain-containing protein [Bacteroidota bacterium]